MPTLLSCCFFKFSANFFKAELILLSITEDMFWDEEPPDEAVDAEASFIT